MQTKSALSEKSLLAPPFVFQRLDARTLVFRSGDLAFQMPAANADWFRPYSLALMAAPRDPSQLKAIGGPEAPNPIEFISWLSESGAILNSTQAPVNFDFDSASLALSRAISTWKYGVAAEGFGKSLNNYPGAITYLIEIAWFVNAASQYLGVARESAKGTVLENLFNQLLNEERDHIDLLLPDLGLSRSDIENHDPTPNARGLVAFFRDAARTDLLSFITCYSLLEAEAVLADKVESQLDFLERKTSLSLQGFRAHFALDLGSGHNVLWENVLRAEANPTITAERLDRVVNSVHVARHQLMAWHSGIQFRAKEAQEINSVLARKYRTPSSFLRAPFSAAPFTVRPRGVDEKK